MKTYTNYFKSGAGTLLLLLAFVLPTVSFAETLTRELQLGMSGTDVSALQTFLAADATLYPQGLVTGYFGSLTKAAVIKFQARNSIATVGRVGPITLAAINLQMNSGSTIGFDTYAPRISSVAIGVSTTSATISWNTDENSSAIAYFSMTPLQVTESTIGTGVSISGTSVLAHTDLRISHSAFLTGLTPYTTYYYVVYVKDASGNESLSWPATFQTTN